MFGDTYGRLECSIIFHTVNAQTLRATKPFGFWKVTVLWHAGGGVEGTPKDPIKRRQTLDAFIGAIGSRNALKLRNTLLTFLDEAFPCRCGDLLDTLSDASAGVFEDSSLQIIGKVR